MTKEEITPFPAENIADPIEAADEWLTYLHSGNTSETGRAAFSAWLMKSESNRAAFQEAEQLWQDLGFVSICADDLVAEGLTADKLAANDDDADQKTAFFSWGKALAAGVAVILGSLALFWQLQPPTQTQLEYTSAVAQIKDITLPDESEVTLSADSELIVTFSDKKRNLELVKGRAYFEVSPDPSRPFVVTAGNTSARAVGTAFDVNANTEGVTVAVTHGIVDVSSFADYQHQQVKAKTQITAGQLVQSQKNGTISAPADFKTDQIVSWKTGRLVYEGQKLSVITAEINRYREKKIRLLGSELQNKRITLSIPADKTEQLISAIKATDKVYVTDTDAEILIGPVERN